MADLVKKIKIKKQDGTFTDYIPIGAEAKNVSTEDGNNLETLINKATKCYNTLLEMKADTTLKIGDFVSTLGYNKINDGGAAEYYIIANDRSYTTDELYLVSMDNINIVALLKDPNIFTNQVKCTEFYDEEEESTYYITEIPYRNFLGEQNVWQLGICHDDTEVLNNPETTIDFANRHGATIAINAGIFALGAGTMMPHGVLIQNGNVLQDQVYTELTSETLGIKPDGTFETFNSKTATAQQILDAGCVNAFAAFTTLIRDGQAVAGKGESRGPRQIIAQKPNKDYVILTASGRLLNTPGLSQQKVQQILIENYGVDFAYELDGGGSVSTVINGQKINENIQNLCEDRAVTSYLYMGKPKIVNKDLKNIYSIVSHLRQDMIDKFTNLRDIWYGYLFLRGPANSTTPGIEFYQQGEREIRSGKIHLNTTGLFVRQRPALDEAERMLFQVTNLGVSYLGDMFGKFYDYCTNDPADTDLDTIENNGFYVATPNTTHTPEAKNFIILHVNTASNKNNRIQFAFPMEGAQTYIWVRRRVTGRDYYNDWQVIGGWKAGTTAQRPTTLLRNGQEYFDTTLNKPIWYDGTKWVDANGENVDTSSI